MEVKVNVSEVRDDLTVLMSLASMWLSPMRCQEAIDTLLAIIEPRSVREAHNINVMCIFENSEMSVFHFVLLSSNTRSMLWAFSRILNLGWRTCPVLENGLLKPCESPFWSTYLSGTHLTDKSGLAGFLFSVRSSIRSVIYLSKTVLRWMRNWCSKFSHWNDQWEEKITKVKVSH